MTHPTRSMVPPGPFHAEPIAPGVTLRRLYPGGKAGPDRVVYNDIPGGQTWSENFMLGGPEDDFVMLVPDIRMPPTGTDEGIQAASDLRIAAPSIGLVVLSQYANPAYALALRARDPFANRDALRAFVANTLTVFSAVASGIAITPELDEAAIAGAALARDEDE